MGRVFKLSPKVGEEICKQISGSVNPHKLALVFLGGINGFQIAVFVNTRDGLDFLFFLVHHQQHIRKLFGILLWIFICLFAHDIDF